jgi:hypothetical protein
MRFYSATKDRLVTRYGTGAYIGATVTVPTEGPDKGKTVLVHDEDAIVALTDAEFSKYAKEYLSLERDGSLRLRTEEEYKAVAAAEEKRQADEEAAAKKAAADAEKKAADEAAAAEKAAATKKETAEREAADKKSSGKKADKS